MLQWYSVDLRYIKSKEIVTILTIVAVLEVLTVVMVTVKTAGVVVTVHKSVCHSACVWGV